VVTIRATRGAVTVHARGKALDEAGPGDVVRVQNLDSRKVVSGRAVAPGLVDVVGTP
jgi:flagella basal body P-ring formation protein FlgA